MIKRVWMGCPAAGVERSDGPPRARQVFGATAPMLDSALQVGLYALRWLYSLRKIFFPCFTLNRAALRKMHLELESLGSPPMENT